MSPSTYASRPAAGRLRRVFAPVACPGPATMQDRRKLPNDVPTDCRQVLTAYVTDDNASPDGRAYRAAAKAVMVESKLPAFENALRRLSADGKHDVRVLVPI